MNPEYVGSHPAPRSAHPHAGLTVPTTTILGSWLTTADHKRIGILYGVSAFVFFLIGGVEALIIRAQLARPGLTLVTADTYNELFTMHGTTMVFLAIMPFGSAFFNYMVPLQIGARDVAFPRLNALSFWMFLAGGILLHTSFLAGTPPAVGWFAYANLTRREYSPTLGVDFWTLSLQVLGASSILAAVNFIVTILNVRAPGLSFMRMPLFTWMTLVVQFLVLLAFPPITCALIFLMFDRFFGTHFYDVAEGGDLHLWQHLFWTFGHPEVYILILPAFGIVSEVLPTFARKPLFGAPVVIYSGVLIGFFGFGVWGHHMFAAGMGPVADSAFAIATMLIAIPTGVKIFNWLATLWGGRIHGTTALHFAAGLIATFTIGGPALRADRRQPLRAPGGRLLLVAEDHRPPPRRAAGAAAVLADLRRLQPDVLSPALPRRGRHAAPDLHLSSRGRLGPVELRLLGRGVRHRARHPALHGQRRPESPDAGDGAR